jgi:hypothetical protein
VSFEHALQTSDFMAAGYILTVPAIGASVIPSGDGPPCNAHEMCGPLPVSPGDEPVRDGPHTAPGRLLVAVSTASVSPAGSSVIFRTGSYTLT